MALQSVQRLKAVLAAEKQQAAVKPGTKGTLTGRGKKPIPVEVIRVVGQQVIVSSKDSKYVLVFVRLGSEYVLMVNGRPDPSDTARLTLSA